MGQVPKYGIIGSGRAARHFSHYLSLRGISPARWARTQASSLATSLDRCDTILVLISDRAIEPFLEEYAKFLASKRVIHFSGALATPRAFGFHPLISFGPDLLDQRIYETMAFVCEDDAPAFAEIFPALPNPHYRIPKKDKALYHALCVLGGNFTTILWQKLFTELRARWDLPEEAVKPYLEAISSNLLHRPDAALTGPLARGDLETIHRNLEALDQAKDPYATIYRAFAQVKGVPL